jgi:FkbM family methyltransferase
MSSIFNKVFRKVFPSKQAKRVKPWMEINGDKTLRLNYALNKESLVFDLGGYEGQWSSDIFSKYQCNIWIFEPFQKYAQNIIKRFEQNEKIKVFEFGLGERDNTLKIFVNDDATSTFRKSGEGYDIKLISAADFINSKGVKYIDLMKINIEGGEYELLESLIDKGFIKNIGNIQVQFHDFVPNAKERMQKIQSSLMKTHKITYEYEFVWENWALK